MRKSSLALAACLISAASLASAQGTSEFILDFSSLPGFEQPGGKDEDKIPPGHAHIIETGPTHVQAIGLTLDDGPSNYTAQVLDLLAKHGAHATFFMIGENVAPHRDAARLVAAGPYQIGNHSYTHPNFCSSEMTRNPNRVRVAQEEVRKATLAIEQATGVAPKLMRMPYGCNARWAEDAVQAMGYDLVFWSVDCRDWSRPGVDQIARISISQAKPGSIILLHDGGGDRSQTVRALEAILNGLHAKGLKVLTVGELMEADPHIKALFLERPSETVPNAD